MEFDPEDLDQPTVLAQAFKPRSRLKPPPAPKPAARKPTKDKDSAKNKDTDGDNVLDAQERQFGSLINREDSDGDGLRDDIEIRLGTHLMKADTDDDGVDDGVEVAFGDTSPRVREPEGWHDGHTQRAIHDKFGRLRIGDRNRDGFDDWIEDQRRSVNPGAGPDLMTPDGVYDHQPLDAFIQAARSQVGKPYQAGAEADPNSEAPSYDHGELVQWAASRAGIAMPDMVYEQWRHVTGPTGVSGMSVEAALRQPGALLMGTGPDPVSGQLRRQIAISLGNGKVIDVNDQGVFEYMDPKPFYTHATRIPELHQPQGDLNGDGRYDVDELLMTGDISKGTVLKKMSSVVDADHDGIPDQVDTDVVDPRGGALATREPGEVDPVAGSPTGDAAAQIASYEAGPGLAPEGGDAADPSAGPHPPEHVAAPPIDERVALAEPTSDGGDAAAEPAYADPGAEPSYDDASSDSYGDSYGDSYSDESYA